MNSIAELQSNGTDFQSHTASMDYTPYAVRHNRHFHGPAWLNINAMQMDEHQKTEDTKKFQPITLYDVYLTDELDFGKPLYQSMPHLEIVDKLDIHHKTFYSILNTPEKCPRLSRKYRFVVSGRIAVEWGINGLMYYNNTEAAKALGLKSSNSLSTSYMRGEYKNRGITRRYVRLDVNENVVEVLG